MTRLANRVIFSFRIFIKIQLGRAIKFQFAYDIQPSLNLNYHPPRPITTVYTVDH